MKLEVKELEPVPPPREFILTLTQEEANMLRTIVGSVGGNSFDATAQSKTKVFCIHLWDKLEDSTTSLFFPKTTMVL